MLEHKIAKPADVVANAADMPTIRDVMGAPETTAYASGSPVAIGDRRPRHAHIWAPQGESWYVEPSWISHRLFEAERFDWNHPLLEPMCGSGVTARAAIEAGYSVLAADIVDRGFPGTLVQDFFERSEAPASRFSIITNPVFKLAERTVLHALELGASKVVILYPIACLCAAAWAFRAPLRRVWLISPRPSMPPGDLILRGEKPQGGRVDYAWLSFLAAYDGAPEIRRLHRDEGAQR